MGKFISCIQMDKTRVFRKSDKKFQNMTSELPKLMNVLFRLRLHEFVTMYSLNVLTQRAYH